MLVSGVAPDGLCPAAVSAVTHEKSAKLGWLVALKSALLVEAAEPEEAEAAEAEALLAAALGEDALALAEALSEEALTLDKFSTDAEGSDETVRLAAELEPLALPNGLTTTKTMTITATTTTAATMPTTRPVLGPLFLGGWPYGCWYCGWPYGAPWVCAYWF